MPAALDSLVVAGGFMMDGFAAGCHLAHLGMMNATLASHHMGLAVSRFVAGDVCAANVAD